MEGPPGSRWSGQMAMMIYRPMHTTSGPDFSVGREFKLVAGC